MTGTGAVDRLGLTVPDPLEGERLDRAVTILTGVSRRHAAALVAAGAVAVDGVVATARSRPVRAGQRLAVDLPVLQADRARPDPAVAFAVVHEDAALVVVDKPAGLVTHHGAGRPGGTLVDGLLWRYPDLQDLAESGAGDPARPGIVHRLDKGTSGLLAVARTPEAYRSLVDQLGRRLAQRRYLALVAGQPADDAGVVDAPIGRSARVATKMAVTPRGKPARTSYRVLERLVGARPYALLECSLQSGRTHQIRVHLTAIGHPVVGDDRYGPPGRGERLTGGRLFLHAHELTLIHPASGEPVSFRSPLPPDLQAELEGRRA